MEDVAAAESLLTVFRDAGVKNVASIGTLLRLWHGPATITELAGATDRSAANMTGVRDRLAEKGLVGDTRGGEDRRLVMVSLTQAGFDLVTKALKAAEAAREQGVVA